MIVKCFGCTTIHNKALYKCIIHSLIQSFTHPHSKSVWLSCVEHETYFKMSFFFTVFVHTIQVSESKSQMDPIYFYSTKKKNTKTSFFVIIILFTYLCIQILLVWNNIRMSKLWQNWTFWVHYPFKICSDYLTLISMSHESWWDSEIQKHYVNN